MYTISTISALLAFMITCKRNAFGFGVFGFDVDWATIACKASTSSLSHFVRNLYQNGSLGKKMGKVQDQNDAWKDKKFKTFFFNCSALIQGFRSKFCFASIF